MAGLFCAALLFFCPSADVLVSGMWPLLSNHEDPELCRLAATLPATVLRIRVDSTTKKYIGAFKRWKTWADSRQGVPSFPVQDIHFALYLQHLSESVESKAVIEEAVHAFSWLHQVGGLQPVGASPLVQRALARPKVRKEPVSIEMLQAMVEAAGAESPLGEVRLLAVCLLAFTL